MAYAQWVLVYVINSFRAGNITIKNAQAYWYHADSIVMVITFQIILTWCLGASSTGTATRTTKLAREPSMGLLYQRARPKIFTLADALMPRPGRKGLLICTRAILRSVPSTGAARGEARPTTFRSAIETPRLGIWLASGIGTVTLVLWERWRLRLPKRVKHDVSLFLKMIRAMEK